MHNYTPNHHEPLVLVVDDDASVRKALNRLLRAAGLNVKVFASGSELLAFERPLQPACLVLDLHLPDFNGFDLLRRILAADPNLPVVVLTGETSPGTSARALEGGARAFMTKPFEESRLLEEIQRLLTPMIRLL